jgi:hypothetical protein
LHALLAVLQALVPLQELIPMQWTLAAFLAEVGVTETPFMASAIAATARLVPETILYFMLISLGKGSRSERQMGLQASPQPLYVGRVRQFTLITRLLPWRRPRETKSGGAEKGVTRAGLNRVRYFGPELVNGEASAILGDFV